MRKLFLILCLLVIPFICITIKTSFANTMVANPWVECDADFECATRVSGIKFPLKLSNYWIRAMKGMIEISYPLDEFRHVSVRKTEQYQSNDISGVYTKYPKNKTLKLHNGVELQIRGKKHKIYVMNMSTNTGYYSAYCEQGMSVKEVIGVYVVIRDAEDPKFSKEAISKKYSNCELGDLVGKDVKRIKHYNYNLDYHSKDFKKKEIINFANECLFKGVESQYEMDCCLTEQMYPEKK